MVVVGVVVEDRGGVGYGFILGRIYFLVGDVEMKCDC